MAKDVSVVFKASDNLSHSISSMRKSVNGLSRDVSEYRKKQSEAFGKAAEVKLDITKAKQALKELDRDVKNNVEGSEKAFKEKHRTLQELNEEYRRLSKNARDASNEERKLQEDINKSKNYGNTMMAQQQSLMKSLANAGLISMIGGAVGSYGGQVIGSTYGETVGSTIGNIGGGIVAGAALGSIVPGIGTAVGAAVGGLTGAIQSLTEYQEKRDDNFREETKSIFSMVKSEQEIGIQSGIATASERERLIMGLGTLLGGQDKGNKMFEDIKQFGISTPYETVSMIDAAKTMLAYGIEEKDIMSDMRMLGEVAMGDQNKFNSLAYAYSQTKSAGKLTGQDKLQYVSAGFNPLTYLAEEQGKSMSEMDAMMSKGLISADDVTRAFRMATSEGGKFYGAMAQQMQTYNGTLSQLNDLRTEITSGYGDGYNKKRMEGMNNEIDQLGGSIGDKMREANSLIGEYKADLENKYQQSIIDSIENAMETPEYYKAKRHDDGVEMGRIMAEARAQAETEYKNSEGYRLQQEADLSIVKSIQEDTAINGAYLEYGYKMADQFTKGWANGIELAKQNGSFNAMEIENAIRANGSIIQKAEIAPTIPSYSSEAYSPEYRTPTGFATGLSRVPYDGYYYAHEGEQIVTKVDADKNYKGNINININNPVIKETADINHIMMEMYNELEKAAFNMV